MFIYHLETEKRFFKLQTQIEKTHNKNIYLQFEEIKKIFMAVIFLALAVT